MNYDTLKFDSCFELGQHVENLNQNNWQRQKGEASTDLSDMPFYDYWSIEKAIACVNEGGNWQEGADKMPEINIPHETLAGRPLEVQTMENDLMGFMPDIGGYLSGAPDCMFTLNDQPQGDKLLRVAVHVGRYARAKQKSIFNRGAAIMAVLDQLSREGYAIELHAIWRNTNEHKGGTTGVSIETIVKHGGDPWSPASVAYALCHVSFQRRLCWRVAESMTNGGANLTNDNNGYGHGADEKFKDFDISFGYVDSKVDSRIRSIETACAYIKEQTLLQLKKLSN